MRGADTDVAIAEAIRAAPLPMLVKLNPSTVRKPLNTFGDILSEFNGQKGYLNLSWRVTSYASMTINWRIE
jgi:hypothetical protein